MTPECFFGYGSLVNLATHEYSETRLARLSGWQRIWRSTTARPAAFLSVEPVEGAEIDGIIAQVPDRDWRALDKREAAYQRREVTVSLADSTDDAASMVYVVEAHLTTPQHPILLSYLDVVVQGYLQNFGEAGVARFFEATSGWDAGVRNDRAAPVYPRHQKLTTTETALVDHWVARTT